LGAKPCNSISGKPTMATVSPSFTPRLSAWSNARSFAAEIYADRLQLILLQGIGIGPSSTR
jgi:hypothetical protein